MNKSRAFVVLLVLLFLPPVDIIWDSKSYHVSCFSITSITYWLLNGSSLLLKRKLQLFHDHIYSGKGVTFHNLPVLFIHHAKRWVWQCNDMSYLLYQKMPCGALICSQGILFKAYIPCGISWSLYSSAWSSWLKCLSPFKDCNCIQLHNKHSGWFYCIARC